MLNLNAPHINILDKLPKMCHKCPKLDLEVSTVWSNDEVRVAVVSCRNDEICRHLLAYMSQSKGGD